MRLQYTEQPGLHDLLRNKEPFTWSLDGPVLKVSSDITGVIEYSASSLRQELKNEGTLKKLPKELRKSLKQFKPPVYEVQNAVWGTIRGRIKPGQGRWR